jgi:hypothetical protein
MKTDGSLRGLRYPELNWERRHAHRNTPPNITGTSIPRPKMSIGPSILKFAASLSPPRSPLGLRLSRATHNPRPHASLATSLACARTARPLLSFLCLVVVVAASVVVVVFLLVFECPRSWRNQTQKFNITGDGLSQSRWIWRSCSSCMQQCNVQCLMQEEQEQGNGKEAGREFVLGLR